MIELDSGIGTAAACGAVEGMASMVYVLTGLEEFKEV